MVRIAACVWCAFPRLVLVGATLFTTFLISPALATPDIVLNEVLGDPARDWDGDGEINSTGDEWVEIYNRGAGAVDLTGYRIGDLDRSWAYGFSGSLQADGRVVVFGSDSKVWQQANGESAYGLRLSNSGDTVVLWQISGSDTLQVDSFTYANHEADDDRSSGRRPDGAEHWELYDGLNGYGGTTPPPGNGCMPTPGASNNCVTAIDESSWGAVKARHR